MEQLNTILNNIQGGVIICNYDPIKKSSEVTYLNRGWTEITGYTLQALTQEKNGNPQALVLPEDKAEADSLYRKQLLYSNTYELLYRIVHKNGDIRWVIDKGIVSPLANGIIKNQSIITEITTIKEQEERLRLLSQTDQLTDLNNKATFALLAQNILSRQQAQCHALMLLDIDNFKGFNDNHGHAFGDKVLEAVASQMKALFRSRDILGRIGGDEFLILMTDIPSSEVAKNKADELRLAIRSVKIPGTKHVPISVSIGGTLFHRGEPYETLFDQADTALYQAKNSGKNQYVQLNNIKKT